MDLDDVSQQPAAGACGWRWNQLCWLEPRSMPGDFGYHRCDLAAGHPETCRCACGSPSPYGPPPPPVDRGLVHTAVVSQYPTAAELDNALRLPPGTAVFEDAPHADDDRFHLLVRVEPAGPDRWLVHYRMPLR